MRAAARRTACLAGLVVGLAACDGLVLDAEEEDGLDTAAGVGGDEDLQGLSDVGGTTVVQVNPFNGGQFDDLDTSGPVTNGTARRFARMLDRFYRRASVIGMEEIVSPENAETIRQILVEETGHPWAVHHFGMGTYPGALPSSQEAIFWRSDVHHVIEDFGTRQVEAMDTSAGPESQSLRFGGLLLRRTGTERDLAMFVGKLAPLGHTAAGQPLTNQDRADEVDRLTRWIEDKLATHPRATRVIAVDTNADHGSEPWQHLRRDYWDGDDDRPTHFDFGARRIDFLFWDMDAGPRRTDGFLSGPRVSPNFGSDHRAVIARVYVRK